MMVPTFKHPPPKLQYALLSFPGPNILLVTLNRPTALNCINQAGNAELGALWSWLDNEPSLFVGIITGAGRAFCAGADLKERQAYTTKLAEWNKAKTYTGDGPPQPRSVLGGGFAGLSRRGGKKPVIAAVNGLAYGGGCETTTNCDLVIASSVATFALPEVKRGVVALAGALPRIVRTIGKQRAMEMALTGRTVSATEAKEWGLVNEVVDVGDSKNYEAIGKKTVEAAVKWAEMICANSPDAVIVSREGIKIGWDGVGAEEGSRLLVETWSKRLDGGDNIKEGLKAFVEKRAPKWLPSKL